MVAGEAYAADGLLSRRAQLQYTALYCCTYVAQGVLIGGAGATVPGIGAKTGATLTSLSYLFVARATGMMIGAILGGKAVDRVRSHRVGAAALMLMAVGAFGTAFSEHIVVTTVLWSFIGFGSGANDCVVNTALSRVWGAGIAVPMQLLHTAFTVGGTISPLITAGFQDAGADIGSPIMVHASFVIGASLAVAAMRSPPAGADSQAVGDATSTVTSEEKSERERDAGDSDSADAKGFGIFKPATAPAARANEGLVIGLISLFLVCANGSELGPAAWLPSYAIMRFQMSDVTASLVLSVFWFGMTLGRFLSVLLAIALRPRTIIMLDLSLAVVGAVMLLSPAQWALWAGAAVAGLGVSSLFPAAVSLPAEIGVVMRGSMAAWFFAGGACGELLLPYVMGQIMAAATPAAFGPVLLATILCAVACFGAVMLAARGRCCAAKRVLPVS